MHLFILLWLATLRGSAMQSEVNRLQPRADAILKLGVVAARDKIEVVFRLADDLMVIGRFDAAARYFDGALRIEPHDFIHHLHYAQTLQRLNQPTAAAAESQIIFKGCEDSSLILKAQDLIGVSHSPPAALGELRTDVPVVVLVPLGDVDLLLLQQEQTKLHDELRVDVEIRSVWFGMPKPNRRPRERTPENRQWSAEQMLAAFSDAVHPAVYPNVRFVGITRNDIYANDYNYLFGWSDGNTAIISYRRFMASFNDEIPQRSRLLRRLHFQCLASAGHLFGLARCNDPSCSRSYPDSLAEQDAKSDQLCDVCRRGFVTAFARYSQPVLGWSSTFITMFAIGMVMIPAVLAILALRFLPMMGLREATRREQTY